MRTTRFLFVLLLLLATASCSDAGGRPLPMLAPGVTPADVASRVEQFAPSPLGFDTVGLEAWEWQVLEKLVAASDVMTSIFERQVSPRVPEWAAQLDTAQGLGKDAAETYYGIMVGPWDRLLGNEPFLDVGPKPAGAGSYPPDLTVEAFDQWLKEHPADREAFVSPFTVIRRTPAGGLEVVAYNDVYGRELVEAARLLREAAELSENPSLSAFLNARAAAFLSNDYYVSDLRWMDVAGSRIEPTIGPYEVYEDELLGYKASFESFITVADPEASATLDALKSHLRTLEERLPIPDRYKNLDRGFESPMRVVDLAYAGGESRAGVQTVAFNLPNDERVRSAKGSKKVMLRNVAQAKFNRILVPIAERVMAANVADRISFQPWFTAVLMHELAHGLGPGFIERDGQRVTVNQVLRETYSPLEEAKADVVGYHSLTVLAELGVYDESFVRRAFMSHVPDLIRAVRFGAAEAHGMANLIQFNWHMEHGTIAYEPALGKFTANVPAMRLANRALAERILTIQAEGDYEAARALLERYGKVSPDLQRAIDRVATVPVDIRPIYLVQDLVESAGGGAMDGQPDDR